MVVQSSERMESRRAPRRARARRIRGTHVRDRCGARRRGGHSDDRQRPRRKPLLPREASSIVAPLFPPVDLSAPSGPMRHRYARVGDRAYLATSPDTHAFGNAILNVAWSFFMARSPGAALCLEAIDPTRYQELWRLECGGIETVRAGSRGAQGMAEMF